ncbi:MAG TPA: hypothetical protein PKC19_12085 [Roseiflexaceae bacterium]|nr:hypothetical protein [Roseiflexaceae bacterium]
MQPSFFSARRSAMHGLLAWGSLSMLAGAAAWLYGNLVVRQIGLQALVWGAIDAALAIAGLRATQQAVARGEAVAPIARRDRRVLALNALLDTSYIAGGWWMIRKARSRADRVGIGIGIMIQGFVLFVLDALLAAIFSRYTRNEP